MFFSENNVFLFLILPPNFIYRSMAFALRKALASGKSSFSISKQQSDLDNLWNQKPFLNSPPVHTQNDNTKDLFGILMEGKQEIEPRKRLYCPPVVKAFTPPQTKKENISFLYRRVTITSNSPITVSNQLQNMVTHIYKGCDNQQVAWDNFKEKISETDYCLISCANMIFFIQKGSVKNKGITGTAERKIQTLSSGENGVIELSSIIQLIDELQMKERLELYSTTPFFYSVMTPIERRLMEMNSSSGIKYRMILSGYIFSPLLSEIGTPKDQMDFSVIF